MPREGPFPILQTKLYPPRLLDTHVQRPLLVNELLEGSYYQLTLISAPAGYGKSILVSQWLRAAAQPAAWLSLDELDNALDSLVAYIIAALSQAGSQITWETADLLLLPQLPPPERLADALLLEIDDLTQQTILVLDDYHAISSSDIHRFIQRLIQRLPDTLHLVLVTRADPPFALGRLRAAGQLRELRAADLRFSCQEAALLVQRVAGWTPDERLAELLTAHLEGWPAGLYLASLSLGSGASESDLAERLGRGPYKAVADYLQDEVLDRLPNEQRLLLLRAAIVDRLCAPLVDVLNERTLPSASGRSLLQELWRSNLFLIALDDQGTWFRFHHLFRQLLQQELARVFSPQAIAGMHLAASRWFEEEGFIEDAILHALEAGERTAAALLVERHYSRAIDAEEWRRIDHWVQLLPPEVQRRPGILVIRALLEQVRFRYGKLARLLDNAEEGLAVNAPDYSAAALRQWQGTIDGLRAAGLFLDMPAQAGLEYARRALTALDPNARHITSLTQLWLVQALQQLNRSAEALTLADQYERQLSGPPDTHTFRLRLARCVVHQFNGDFASLRQVAVPYQALAVHSGHWLSLGWANFVLGESEYQRNELSNAAAYFEENVRQRYQIHVLAAFGSLVLLAHARHALGNQQAATEAVAVLRQFALDQNTPAMITLADAIELRFAGGPASRAQLAALSANAARQLGGVVWEPPVLTACYVDIRYGDPCRLDQAAQNLDICALVAQERNNIFQLLRIGALRALLYDAHDEPQAALASLRQAVLLGEAGGGLRIFADYGTRLLPYLRQLVDAGIAPAYASRIMSVIERDRAGGALEAEGRGPALSAEAVTLMGELTNRELEVLDLLAQRLTNKEIAARLHISPRTVKKHTINLYQKLAVDNRRQAVASALALGILKH